MHPDTALEQFYTRSHLPGVPRPFHQLPPEERIDWGKRMEKAQFEAWAKRHHYDLTRCSHEPYAAYRSDLTNAAWAAWRGANGESSPQPDERAALTDQQIYDEFYFLEGMVSERNYRLIADTAIKIARATAPQATVQVVSPVCPHPCRYAHSIDHAQIAGPKEGE